MRVASIVLLIAMSASAQANPIDDILAEATADCALFDDGVLTVGDSVTEVNLDGMAPLDALVDMGGLECSSTASLYCGSGGCSLYAVVGDRAWSFQAEGWRMTDWDGRPILLIARDGGWCGGSGAETCFEAVSWSNGAMMTVMAPLE